MLNIAIKYYFREMFGSALLHLKVLSFVKEQILTYTPGFCRHLLSQSKFKYCCICSKGDFCLVVCFYVCFFPQEICSSSYGKTVLFVEQYCLRLTSSLILSFKGLLCDLLWSDPDKDVQGWGENDRGVSFTFGADVVSKFLNRHDLDLICRAHQV